MKITLSPLAAFEDDALPTINGEVLTYRGESYDLSQLPNGASVEADSPFVGSIARDDNGVVSLTLQYQYNMETAEENQSTDWADYTFDTSVAPITCPILRKPEPEIVEPIVEEPSQEEPLQGEQP